jgi:hypothetical protein
VEAIQFLGSPASALEVIDWAHAVLPGAVVRERIEYRGWDDQDGHLELEIRESDMQAISGDWLVCSEPEGRPQLEVIPGSVFHQRFEPLT